MHNNLNLYQNNNINISKFDIMSDNVNIDNNFKINNNEDTFKFKQNFINSLNNNINLYNNNESIIQKTNNYQNNELKFNFFNHILNSKEHHSEVNSKDTNNDNNNLKYKINSSYNYVNNNTDSLNVTKIRSATN